MVLTLLPADVESRLLEFLKAGKTGTLELHITQGSIASVKLVESWRIAIRE